MLVDRLWPRGCTREAVDADEWDKSIAPSPELRRWYAHDVSRFDEFARLYRDELRGEAAAEDLARLRTLSTNRGLVLLTATRDIEYSHANVLLDVLAQSTSRARRRG